MCKTNLLSVRLPKNPGGEQNPELRRSQSCEKYHCHVPFMLSITDVLASRQRPRACAKVVKLLLHRVTRDHNTSAGSAFEGRRLPQFPG